MHTLIKCATGVMSLFIFLISYYSAFRGGLEPQLIAVSLLGFVAAMVFLTKPANRKSKNPRGNVMMGIDFTFAIIMVLMETYILFNYKDFVISGMIGQITQFEMFIGFVYIILILEATRRIGGLPIVILAIFAMTLFMLTTFRVSLMVQALVGEVLCFICSRVMVDYGHPHLILTAS